MGSIASQITSITIVYSSVYSGADQRKHQSPASLAFARGIHRWPVNSPHKGPVTRKMSSWQHVINMLEGDWLCRMWAKIGPPRALSNYISIDICWGYKACWRHQMETFSALLALCEGNPPVTGGFPTQRPVTRSFDVFFGVRLNKRLSK